MRVYIRKQEQVDCPKNKPPELEPCSGGAGIAARECSGCWLAGGSFSCIG